MNFLDAPIQSATLLAHDIPSPLPIDDATAVNAAGDSQATKRARRSDAADYRTAVMLKVGNGTATPDDLLEATIYEEGIKIIELLPSIQRVMPAVNAAQVAHVFQPQFDSIANQFTLINARLDQTRVRQLNLFLERDEDSITPMIALPVMPLLGHPMIAPAPVPSAFPNTKEVLYKLSGNILNKLLAYYGLVVSAEATVAIKREHLAVHLGIPPVR